MRGPAGRAEIDNVIESDAEIQGALGEWRMSCKIYSISSLLHIVDNNSLSKTHLCSCIV